MPRRKLSAMAEACLQLIEELHQGRLQGGVFEEVQSRWLGMWQELTVGNQWREIDIDDLGIIVHTGWNISMYQKDYQNAIRLLQEFYFAHPQIRQADEVDRISTQCQLALTFLMAGEEGQAIAAYRSALTQDDRKQARMALLTARNQLLGFCRNQPDTAPAPQALKALVEEVVRRMRGWRRKGIPDGATYGQLYAALIATYA